MIMWNKKIKYGVIFGIISAGFSSLLFDGIESLFDFKMGGWKYYLIGIIQSLVSGITMDRITKEDAIKAIREQHF